MPSDTPAAPPVSPSNTSTPHPTPPAPIRFTASDDWDATDDVDGFQEKAQKMTVFAFRKVFFFASLCGMMSVGVWSPSLRHDIAYWGLILQFVYFSLDIEAHMNRYFLLLTHPTAFCLAAMQTVLGFYILTYEGDLFRTRAEADRIDLFESIVLHVLAYWVPLALLMCDLYWSRRCLKRRYLLHLSWPVQGSRTRLAIGWILLAAPSVLVVWWMAENGWDGVYRVGPRDQPALITYLVLTSLLSSIVFSYLVRFTSDFFVHGEAPRLVIR